MSDHIKLNNPAFIYVDEVNQICQGLFRRYGLNAFSYSKIYPDGSRAELWSDAYALDHSFFVKKHIERVYTADLFNHQKFVFYDIAADHLPNKTKNHIQLQLKDQRELFNHANCMLIIEYQKEYTEYFTFYTPIEKTDAKNSYLNCRDSLAKFCKYFKRRAYHLIMQSDRERLIRPWRDREGDSILVNVVNESFSPAYGMTNLTENNQPIQKLTAREKEIADLLCEGKTGKEMADTLCISHKTVEKHIENMKQKFHCKKRSQLISIILERQL